MKTKDMILIAMFTVLMIIGAKLMIPMPLVPFTLQPLVCMLTGILLGSKRGLASQLLYLAMGLIGIPVFTGGGGLGTVMAPTFGYLIGFAAGTWLMGLMSEKFCSGENVSLMKYFLVLLPGIAVIYLIGVAYLYVVLNYWTQGKAVGVIKVIQIGFLATILPDILKAFIAAAIAVRLKKTGIFAGRTAA